MTVSVFTASLFHAVRQLVSAIFCNFLQQRSSLRPVTCHHSRRGEPKLFYCRVNTSTPLHLLVWLHCSLLSSSCPLTGSGSWGLVPATNCDMLTKRAGTSRFQKIHRKKEHVGGKGGFYTERRVSAGLCCGTKASRFPPFYLMDGCLSSLKLLPFRVGQISKAGHSTGSQNILFNCSFKWQHHSCSVSYVAECRTILKLS